MNTIISIKHLVKNYGDKQVLKGIDLEIAPGQVIGYIGPNGAGKSTTVKILTGLISDYEGEVSVLGYDMKTQSLEAKAHIGYIPENAELYEVLTPMEYLHFVGQLYNMPEPLVEERARQMLTAFGLEDNLDNRMDSFSKGMRQKVLIISGLLHNPQIVIMDEPLSGLDANSVIIIKELISQLAAEGKTVFYCSHMMDVVEKVSDRIILLHDGHLMADGTFEDLQKQNGGSLEQIFARLTGKTDLADKAGEIIRNMNQN